MPRPGAMISAVSIARGMMLDSRTSARTRPVAARWSRSASAWWRPREVRPVHPRGPPMTPWKPAWAAPWRTRIRRTPDRSGRSAPPADQVLDLLGRPFDHALRGAAGPVDLALAPQVVVAAQVAGRFLGPALHLVELAVAHGISSWWTVARLPVPGRG